MKRNVWAAIVLLCMLGLVAQAEIIRNTSFGNGADTYVANDVDNLSPDANFGSEVRMRYRNNGSNRCRIAYIRFDLSEVTGDLSGGFITFQTTWMKSGGKTVTVYGLTDETLDNWSESAITFNTAPGILPSNPGVYNRDGTKTVQLGTFQSSSSAAPVILTTNPASLNMTSFLQSNTNGLVTLLLIGVDDETELATKENTTYMAPTLTLPNASLGRAVDPDPEDESAVNLNTLTQLSWTLLPGVAKCDVYFGTEPNTPEMDMLSFTPAVEAVAIDDFPSFSTPLAERTYYWRVDCYDSDPVDPNLFVGLYWSFTATSAPVFSSITPAYQAKFEGETADDITVIFNSTSELTYTWYKSQDNANNTEADDTLVDDGIPDDTLSLGVVDATDAGWYYCVATNPGEGRSNTVRVTIKRKIAHYAFDGNTNDSSGSGLHGTPIGDLNYQAGAIDQAVVFDGSTNYVECPNDFSDFSAGITISVWAYPNAVADWARFVDLGNKVLEPEIERSDIIYLARNAETTTLSFNAYAGETGTRIDAADAISLNEWQMFVATLDEAGNVVLYKNGLPIQTGTISQMPHITVRTSNFIGRSNWWEDDALYSGVIDDLQIYNYAISEDNVADMYSNVVGNYCRYTVELDYSGNCIVDLPDLAIFVADWLQCGLYPECP